MRASVYARGDEGFERVREFHLFGERQAGEGFTDAEGDAVAVVVAIVVGREGRGLGHFAGKQAARERKADDDGNPLRDGVSKDCIDGLLAEEVENLPMRVSLRPAP
jgi:hypothetical protein